MHKQQPPKVEKFVNDVHRDSVETHPAYAQIAVSRVHGHTSLYASDFKHNDFITVTIRKSDVTRNLSNDWHHGGNELIEVAMSESQWATFISTPNSGMGTPCTLQFFASGGPGVIPGIVHPTNKTDQFTAETSGRLDEGLAQLRKLAKAIESSSLSGKAKREFGSMIEMAIMELSSNIGFVADQFGEHVEAVTDAAKTEIHAYIENAISRAGLRAIAAGNERPFEMPSGSYTFARWKKLYVDTHTNYEIAFSRAEAAEAENKKLEALNEEYEQVIDNFNKSHDRREQEILTLRAELEQARKSYDTMSAACKFNVEKRGELEAALASYVEGAHQIAQEMKALEPAQVLNRAYILVSPRQRDKWAEAILALGTKP